MKLYEIIDDEIGLSEQFRRKVNEVLKKHGIDVTCKGQYDSTNIRPAGYFNGSPVELEVFIIGDKETPDGVGYAAINMLALNKEIRGKKIAEEIVKALVDVLPEGTEIRLKDIATKNEMGTTFWDGMKKKFPKVKWFFKNRPEDNDK